MEKPVVTIGRYAIFVLAFTLSGCQSPRQISLTEDQQAELVAYRDTFDNCVIRNASNLDDGRTEIPRIAGMAMAYCQPEEESLASFLDSIPFSSTAKAQYLDNLVRVVGDRSATILQGGRKRHNRIS